MLGFERITFDRRIMAGQACPPAAGGMRIPASVIVNLVAQGKQVGEILKEVGYHG